MSFQETIKSLIEEQKKKLIELKERRLLPMDSIAHANITRLITKEENELTKRKRALAAYKRLVKR